MEPAAKQVNMVDLWVVSRNSNSPIATVYCSRLVPKITFAKMKSDHGEINAMSAV